MKERRRNLLKVSLLIIIVAELVIIFLFSNQSSVNSYNLTGEAISIVTSTPKTQEEWNIRSMIIPVVRKLAHVFLYLLLGVTIIATENIEKKLSNISLRRKALYAVCLTTIIGALDETHQIFIPGRGASITDVFIDMTGAILGVLFFSLFQRVLRRGRKRENCL